MVSGMPVIVSINKNNNCKFFLDNCAPYDVTISKNDILGIMDAEPDNPIIMEDWTISAILQDLENKLPKVPKRKLTNGKIANKANVNVPEKYKQKNIDNVHKHQQAISVTSMTLVWQQISNKKFI